MYCSVKRVHFLHAERMHTPIQRTYSVVAV